MFVKIAIAIAIALILGTASEALAAPKQKHNTNRTYLYDAHGQHGASASRVKKRHAKTAHKEKHRTQPAYVSHESLKWAFGRAANTVVMANPKQRSNRQYELYNTRAQYSGFASRPPAMTRQGHSSNPATTSTTSAAGISAPTQIQSSGSCWRGIRPIHRPWRTVWWR